MQQHIQYIDVDRIDPHPENPRKGLGDLSELVDSIKANGVLQNLTVVPWFSENTSNSAEPATDVKGSGRYRVVIGHRRLAAAKLAGLKQVPCIITIMSHKDQVATMLLENMQRSDLTIYEQAQGFQMMLDLGETVNSVSEKTGLSKSTVRHRVKLLELDQEKLKKTAQRGATLQDYLELEKIKDISLRNSVLDKIGTKNFDYELQQAVDKEKVEKSKANIIEQLKKFATQVENGRGMRYVQSYNARQVDTISVPKDAGSKKYYFEVSDYGYITLYEKYAKMEAESAESEHQKELRERHDKLAEITKRAYKLRKDFIKGYSGAKKHVADIIRYAVHQMTDSYFDMDDDTFADILKIKIGEETVLSDEIDKQLDSSPEYVFLVAVYCAMDDGNGYYFDWRCQHEEDSDLSQVYDFLEKLGYQMSDEERALRDGTHELFIKDDDKK